MARGRYKVMENTSVRQPLSINRCPFLVIPSEAEGPAVRLHPSPIPRKTLPLIQQLNRLQKHIPNNRQALGA
jgi:hypothetical protein